MSLDQNLIDEDNKLILLLYRRKLAGVYQDAPAHFVTEILQNASDCGSETIEFILFERALVIINDGALFTEENLRRIRIAWSSDKGEGKIGRFGIGFKSVYFHSDCVDILSGSYRFRMPVEPWPIGKPWPENHEEPALRWGDDRNLEVTDLVDDRYAPLLPRLPEAVRAAIADGSIIPRTCFILHLSVEAAGQISNIFRQEAKNADRLLFLPRLRRVQFLDVRPESSQQHIWEKFPEANRTTGLVSSRCRIIASSDSELPHVSYYEVFSRTNDDRMIPALSLAFLLKSEEPGAAFLPLREKERRLWAWFPTKISAPWNFILQGHFKLKPNREFLDDDKLEDATANSGLIAETGPFFHSVLDELIRRAPFSAQGFSVEMIRILLPTDKTLDEDSDTSAAAVINQILRNTIRNFLTLVACMPGVDGRACAGEHALIAHASDAQVAELSRIWDRVTLAAISISDGNEKAWLPVGLHKEMDTSQWKRVGVTSYTGADLATTLRVEWLQETRFNDWYKLLSGFESINQNQLLKLKTELLFPAIDIKQERKFSPLFRNTGDGLEACILLETPDFDHDLLRPDPLLNEAVILWARERLGLRNAEMGDLIRYRLIPNLALEERRVGDDELESHIHTFREVIQHLEKSDVELLQVRAFIPAVSANGGIYLLRPASCLIADQTLVDAGLNAGFECFLQVNPDLKVIQPALWGKTLLWFETMSQANVTYRDLLVAWGVRTPLAVSLREVTRVTDFPREMVSIGREGHSHRLIETEIEGLQPTIQALASDVLFPPQRRALFNYFWFALSLLSGRPHPRKRPDRLEGEWPKTPLVCVFEWQHYKKDRGRAAVQQPLLDKLKTTPWFIEVDGTRCLPANVDMTFFNSLPFNAPPGMERLCNLLGIGNPSLKIGELEKIAELKRRFPDLRGFLEGTVSIDDLLHRLTPSDSTAIDAESEAGISPLDLEGEDLPNVEPDGPTAHDLVAATDKLCSLIGDTIASHARRLIPGVTLIDDTNHIAWHLVSFLGDNLLSDKELRMALIEAQLTAREHDSAWLQSVENVLGVRNRPPEINDFEKRNWRAGSRWARWLTKRLDLAPAFSGSYQDPRPPSEEIIEAPRNPGELRKYQREVVDTVSAQDSGTASRHALVELPTGSGKTRVAAEGVIRMLQRAGDSSRSLILWAAPGEELLEQAFAQVRDVFIANSLNGGPTALRGLKVRRWFGGRLRDADDLEPEAGIGGTIILITYATLAELDAAMIARLKSALVMLVLDEAHLATAPTYLEKLKILKDTPEVDILGMTATPNDQIQAMLGHPIDVDTFAGESPFVRLISEGVLARPVRVCIESNHRLAIEDIPDETDPKVGTRGEFRITANEAAQEGTWRWKLAADTNRRDRIVAFIHEHLSKEPNGRVLVFGSSLEDASSIESTLRVAGTEAVTISGRIRGSLRRKHLQRFHTGEIRVLCNFGVLTTGFDEPLVTAVVVARPTQSDTLYSQMVGRGLRGVNAGGAEICAVADVMDTFSNAIDEKKMARDRWWNRVNQSLG